MFTVDEPGTSEAAWLTPLARCADLAWTAGHTVVIAPHPDDEVLAVGGLMRASRSVTVVAVTDGEASHPRSPTITPPELADLRAAERSQALRALDVEANVVRMRCPDGAVAQVVDLARQLAPYLRRADVCLAPWAFDGHPDHDACGRAAITACAAAGVPLRQFPLWAWHWAALRDLPWSRLRRFALTTAASCAKQRAIAAFRSQIAPLSAAPGDEAVLPPAVLARFARPFEAVLV